MQQFTTNHHISAQVKRPSVLLIDCDEKRQFGRAARMRGSGVNVDCASDGATAYTLWRPENYALVLIDFCGADDLVRAFFQHVKKNSPLQKIGFYRDTPPFIDSSATSEMPSATPRTADAPPHAPSAPVETAQRGNGNNGISDAAMRIAVLHPRARSAAPRPPRRPGVPPAETNASIAARVLGGE